MMIILRREKCRGRKLLSQKTQTHYHLALAESSVGSNESPKFELPGLWEARGSSRAPPAGGAKEARYCLLDGDKDE